ncbi:hypothetical protein GY45DRAFT_933775 [Cubamyces sp. BRFM 1775]|nr:hypothetical protein GY45DRAFT_933775 [Cubamyces sp. BRFM 1775]
MYKPQEHLLDVSKGAYPWRDALSRPSSSCAWRWEHLELDDYWFVHDGRTDWILLTTRGSPVIGSPESNPERSCTHSRATCAQLSSVHGPAVSPSSRAESAPTRSPSVIHPSLSRTSLAPSGT